MCNVHTGQTVAVVAVGDGYTSWEGYKDEATGETRIGLSYNKLCQSVQPGGIILLGDGAISIQVRQHIIGRQVETLPYKLNCVSSNSRHVCRIQLHNHQSMICCCLDLHMAGLLRRVVQFCSPALTQSSVVCASLLQGD